MTTDAEHLAMHEALTSLAASDAAMEMATAELLAKDAQIERVKAVVDSLERMRDRAAEATKSDGHRNAIAYAYAYDNAVYLLHEALRIKP